MKPDPSMSRPPSLGGATTPDPRLLWAILDSTLDMVLVHPFNVGGEPGRFRVVNDAACRALGYTRDELMGLTPLELIVPEDVGEVEPEAAALAENSELTFRKRLRTKVGQVLVAEIRTRITTVEGERIAVSVARDIRDRLKREEALRLSEKRHRALAVRLQAVREEERQRLARELHDHVGQGLAALGMDLAEVEQALTATGGSLGAARQMREILDDLTAAVQDAYNELRPPMLDLLGLGPTIRWYLEWAERHWSLRGELDDAGGGGALEPGDPRAVTLFRVFQEAVRNVASHARARTLRVRLEAERGELTLEVGDDGVGIPERVAEELSTTGLLGIRESLEAVNGRLQVSATEGGGTTLRAVIPIGGEP